jgi:hypothetical protein
MDNDEGLEHANDAPARERHAGDDVQALAVPSIDYRQHPHPTGVVERLRREVDRPGLVEHRRRRERLPDPLGYAPRRPPWQIEP